MKAHFFFSAFAFLHLLVNTSGVLAQDRITFNRIPPPIGLHPGSKACIQDSQGYMWIGTYQAPLRRFDGYHYTCYSNDPLDTNSLAQNWVEALCAGKDGSIWVGTDDHGLDKFEPATGYFKHFTQKLNVTNSLSSNNITALWEDRQGLLWIGTSKGLDTYDAKTGKFEHYYYKANDPYSLSCNQVQKIYEDKEGTIWVGTGSVWLADGDGGDEGGLNRFDKRTGKFTRYLHDVANPTSLINNKVKAIFEDSRGTFWVGTAGDGLHTMDKVKGTFQRHLYDPAHPEKLSRPPQKQIRPDADDHITFIIEDSSGAVWIGTFGNGLNRYDAGTNTVTHYPLIKDPVTGMQLEVPWWGCTSRDGMLWIGYWRGLYRADPSRKNIPYVATGTAVMQIYADRFGAVWYGTDEGLVRKDQLSSTERHFVHNANNPHSISNNRVGAIYEDRSGELWIGTEKGLDRFNRNTGSFSHFHFNNIKDDGLINDGVGAIYEDRQGLFWLGTQKGLVSISRQGHSVVAHYLHNTKDSNSISQGEIVNMYEDKAGDLWLATFGGTLNRFSPQTGKVQRFLNSTNIHSLWQDAEGIMWVGTSAGLYRSDIALHAFTRFNAPNGELAGNMIVNGVLEDDEKNLWISASAGICRINNKRNTVVTFSRYEDPAWYNGTGNYKDKNGKLFFGGSGGYFAFRPGQLTVNTKPPQIVINEFRVADKPVKTGKQSPLIQTLSQTREIHLSYDQNFFSFSFAGIHFSCPEKNQHLYMLECLDNTWRKAGDDKTAYYYNVPPGQYFFRVKAANSDDVWAMKSIVVIIAFPWWRTWWAYLLYVAGFAALTYLLSWYRSHFLMAENLLLEERVIRRTSELEQSLKEKYELGKKVERQQALINERLRISRELHDDIGSTLGSISIYSEVAKKRTEKNENTYEVLSKIGNASRELIDKMSDIVWSLKPGNESFQQLQKRMMAFAAMIFAPFNIQYDFITDKEFKRLQLTKEQHKNIFLIFKEALYNIVKHADCKTVWITLSVQNNNLLMTIQDDGIGFDVTQTTANEIHFEGKYSGGNGIKNMQARADDIKAKICINSKAKEGTTVQLTLPLSNSPAGQLPNMVTDIPAKK